MSITSRILDQFYTPPKEAKRLISLLNLNLYDTIIEPSAGTGSFSLNIKHPNVIAYDIDPKHKSIKKQDYLK